MTKPALPKGVSLSFVPKRSTSKPWVLRVKNSVSGKMKVLSFTDETHALKWVEDEVLSEETVQKNRHDFGLPEKRLLVVRDSMPLWFENRVLEGRYARTSIGSYRSIILQHLVPYFGQKAPDEITRADIFDYVGQLRRGSPISKKPLQDKTLKEHLGLLGCFLESLVQRDEIAKNIVAEARRGVFSKRSGVAAAKAERGIRQKIYSKEEVRALLEAAGSYDINDGRCGSASPGQRGDFYYILVFFLNTAARIGEICSLTHGDILRRNRMGEELPEPLLRINKKTTKLRNPDGSCLVESHTKGREERLIPLNQPFAVLLDQWLAIARTRGYPMHATAPLFPLAVDYRRLSKAVRRIAQLAGIPKEKWGPHCFRHTAITYLLEAGVPEVKVARIVGHKQVSTLRIYTHLSAVDTRGATSSLGWTASCGAVPRPSMPQQSTERHTRACAPSDEGRILSLPERWQGRVGNAHLQTGESGFPDALQMIPAENSTHSERQTSGRNQGFLEPAHKVSAAL